MQTELNLYAVIIANPEDEVSNENWKVQGI